MTPENLRDLYLEQLRDLYSAEQQILDALPEMAEHAASPELKQAFQRHLEESRNQKDRLDRVFEMLGESPQGEHCEAMEGLIKEAQELLKKTSRWIRSDSPPAIRDAGMIAQAQRIEHYEIAAYGTVVTYAEWLGRKDEHTLLAQTLDEEKQTDETLTRLAETVVNPAAASQS